MIRVSDLKQYIYCPRIVFYNYCMPVEKKTSFKMDLGSEVHEVVEKLEERRKLKKFNIDSGERHLEVWMRSETLGLSGKLDMLILADEDAIPVDFKHTSGRPGKNHLYQLAGYALLVEETFGITVDKGFIYLIPVRNAVVFHISEKLKEDTKQRIAEIEKIIESEVMPSPASKGKCYDCEYLNFCRDIF